MSVSTRDEGTYREKHQGHRCHSGGSRARSRLCPHHLIFLGAVSDTDRFVSALVLSKSALMRSKHPLFDERQQHRGTYCISCGGGLIIMDSLRQRDISPRPGNRNNNTMSIGEDCFGQLSETNDDHNHHTTTATCFQRCKNKHHPGSISNLCSATLGAGALSLPFAISLTGIVFGILLLILSAYLTVVSIDVIIQACCQTQLYKYEDVTVKLAGRKAGRVLEISLLVFCFGTAVAYIVAVGDILDQGLRSIPYLWVSDNTFSLIYSRERIMILFWTLVMFPLSLQRTVESLERFSSLGVLSIIFLVLAAVIHSITKGDVMSNGEETQSTTDISSMLWPKSFWDIIQAFPIIIFAFSCQVNVCAIYEELTPPPAILNNEPNEILHQLKSKQNIMSGITRKGAMLCMTLYICIGMFGYLDFTNETTDNILNNYCIQTTHDTLMTVASVFVAVAVVVAFPFNILPARVTLKLILERTKRRRRCGICYSFFSSLGCDSYLWPWSSSVDNIDTASASSSAAAEHVNVTDPLLDDDRFGDRPNLVPHMSLEGLPRDEEEMSVDSPPVEHFLLTLLLSGSALIIALLIPDISIIFGLMGGTAASIISFILPGMFMMNNRDEGDSNGTRRKQILPYLFVIGGTVVGALATIVTLYGLVAPTDNTPIHKKCGE